MFVSKKNATEYLLLPATMILACKSYNKRDAKSSIVE